MRIITRGFGPRESDNQMIVVRGFGPIQTIGEILSDSGLLTNLKRSIEKYIYDNIYSSEDIDVDWAGLVFDDTGSIEWIQPRIININRKFLRQADADRYGNENFVDIRIEIFVKKSDLTISDRHYAIRDIVADYFKIGEEIDLTDYVDGEEFLENMKVRQIIDDRPLPETNELLGYEITWRFTYLEKVNNSI